MTVRKALAASAVVFAITFLITASGIPARALASAGLQGWTPTPAQTETIPPLETPSSQFQAASPAIQTAFQEAVNQNREQVLGFLLYDVYVDHIDYSQDGSAALIWIGLRDAQTGEVVASEPGLSIARKANQGALDNPDSWTIGLPSDANFADQLRALPAELQTQDVIDRFLVPADASLTAAAQVFGGYKLPWTAGLAKRITNSIGHVVSVSGGLTSCPATCRYAYDFADGTMFPMIAAKGGTVKAFKTTCPNFGTNCTNYLTVEDQSTIPTSYQIYYHMAYNTIPERLRTVGATVTQGEYIGDADDTGASTGHHLHYHVYTTPNASNWSWGTSVDFTFDDVPVNGGRPRTCAEASAKPEWGSQCLPGNLYTSGNTPAHPPSGTLDLPADRQMISTRTARVAGSAFDDIQIARIQVLVNYDGIWRAIDDIPPNTNGPYAKDVDLCAANIPDGPFKLTVRIYDREGSQAAGLPVRQLIKAVTCGTAQPLRDLRILFPTSANRAPALPFRISAAATDFDGGPVAEVEFFWHGPDWTKDWVMLGVDNDGSDGWTSNINPATYGGVQGSSLYVQANGRAGGVKGATLMDLQADNVTPVSMLDPMPAEIGSNVFLLNWTAADLQNDIDHFELQYQEKTSAGTGPWTNWQDKYHPNPIPGNARTAWFSGTAGKGYNIRLRAVDRAGNAEPWVDTPGVVTAIRATCTPDPGEIAGQNRSNATRLARNSYSSSYNFCSTTATGINDSDWFVVDAQAGEALLVWIFSNGGGSAFTLNMYSGSSTQPQTWRSADYESTLAAKLIATTTGKYYLEITPLHPEMVGTDMRYQVWVGPGNWQYFPVIGR